MANVESPTALAFTPSGRLLVTTQFGEVRVIDGGTLLAAPALDLAGDLCTADEMGLLGVAVDPAFAAASGYVYLYYTRSKPGRCVNRVSRFAMSGTTIDAGSELVLVDEIPATGNHNAGDVRFGKDGYLYVSVGDGGCDHAGDSGCAGQNDASRDEHVLVGKILRITADGGIPASNPFQGAGTARCNVTGRTTAGNRCQETFAWGLRNPFRFAFDPNAASTRFYVNDVGQGVWEEIDLGQAGADYGWNVREGPCANGSETNCGPPPAGMTNPIYAYSHSATGCAAITGGAFVPNGAWPASYDGAYLYGDYTCGKIFQLASDGSGGFTRTEFATGVGAVVNMTFGPSANGQALYYTNYDDGGEVRRIEPTAAANRPPTAQVTATPRSGAVPLSVSFDGSTSSDPDAGDTLTYVWSFGDGSPTVTTATPTTSHTYTAAGSFTATLTVRDQRGAASPAASVRIDPGNTPPQVTIDSPTTTARFAVGETVTLSATATDAEDGPLPASSLSWRVLRHHDTHTHPFLAPTPGNNVSIEQPAPEDLGSGIDGFLRIHLTATDSSGVATTVTRDVLPRKVDLTFATNPAGRQVVVSGTAYTGPSTVTSWAGHTISVDAPAQTDGSGTSWSFQSWSDGGAAAHSFATPAAPTTYTATFAQSATPAGLVAAYGLNGTAADASGRGNSGSVSGAVWSASGRFGSALSFDGVNDWVTVADAASLDLTSGMTVEAWVRPSRLDGWRTVVFKERAGGVVYGLFTAQGSARPLGQVDIGGERNAVGSASLPLNAWSHLATTFDGAVVRLYVNGTLAGLVAVHRCDPGVDGAVAARRQQRLVGVVRRSDRRGARLQPRAQRERDPAGLTNTRRRHASAGRHDATVGAVRFDRVRHDRLRHAWLDDRQRQRRRRPLQRPPLDDGRVHAGAGEPNRAAHRHGLHGFGSRPRHLLLPRHGRGRGGQRRCSFRRAVRGRSRGWLRRSGGCVWVERGLRRARRGLLRGARTRDDVGRDVELRRPVRVGVELRRRERLGDGGRCGVARSLEWDDGGGVGAPDRPRPLADDRCQGALRAASSTRCRRARTRRGRLVRWTSAASGTPSGRRRCR